jgi:ABC-2 type transport system ATP-binding protein
VNAQVLKDAVLEMRRRGATVVFSTHDMATAERMCDRIFMIFRGRKVLDGSLESIQDRYGADTVRIRTSHGAEALAGMPDVESVNDFGQIQEVRLKGEPQGFLARLAQRTSVYHFEVTRPSLQDIFVRIAKPDASA